MPKCYILIGMPTSGKSTWAKKQGLPIISCDEIRKEFGTNYDPEQEKMVWDCFYKRLPLFTKSFIVDNTNSKSGYINKIKECLGKDFEIEYVWFDIPLWKAYYRNVVRYLIQGKWIPFKVLDSMYNNYNKLKNHNEKGKTFW